MHIWSTISWKLWCLIFLYARHSSKNYLDF